ncbi:hypothetical protein F7U66_10985 [Vibrio parahaemolyticus]|nr:hypothetical protein [Vibrio parahaemolyticus]
MAVAIQYTNTFNANLGDQVGYLSMYESPSEVIERLEECVESFEAKIEAGEDRVPCQELALLGVFDVYQCKVGGMRFLYRVEASTGSIIVLVLVREQQDFAKTVVDHCITHVY